MRSALLALLLVPIAAQAQAILTPGSPALAAPPPQAFDFEVRMQGQVAGQMTQAEYVDGDRLVMIAHLSVPGPQVESTDTTTVTWPGLAPVARATYGDESIARIMYGDGRVAGRSVLGNLDEALDAPLPADAFAEGTGARLARSLPLQDGYTATYQIVDRHGDVATGHLAVTGPTDRDGAAVWQVEVVEPGGLPPIRYAIDGATRAILSATVHPNARMLVEVGPAPR